MPDRLARLALLSSLAALQGERTAVFHLNSGGPLTRPQDLGRPSCVYTRANLTIPPALTVCYRAQASLTV